MTRKELDKLLHEKGKKYVLMLHCNWFITLKDNQLDYVLNYSERGDNCGRNRKNKSISCRN